MAFAFVQEFDTGDDRGTPNYDAVSERLRVDKDPPAGMIVHTAGFTDDGKFRIFDVWETREDQETFMNERLMPAMQEIMPADAGPPDWMQSYELHHVVSPG